MTLGHLLIVAKRLKCVKMIPPTETEHDGPHSHSLDATTFHFCEVRCANCGYFCTLPLGQSTLRRNKQIPLMMLQAIRSKSTTLIMDRWLRRDGPLTAERTRDWRSTEGDSPRMTKARRCCATWSARPWADTFTWTTVVPRMQLRAPETRRSSTSRGRYNPIHIAPKIS